MIGHMGERSVRAFEAVLPPGTQVEATPRQDRDVFVSVAGRRLRLRWLPVGWPRQLTEALEIKPRPDIVVAPQFSPVRGPWLAANGWDGWTKAVRRRFPLAPS